MESVKPLATGARAASPSAGLADVSRPFPGERSLSATAAREAALVDGQVPDEFRPSPKMDALYSAFGRGDVLEGATIGLAVGAAIGAVGRAGWAPTGGLAAAGAVGGALLKAYMHTQHNKGTVDVNGSPRPFKVDPAIFERTPEEARIILTSKGQLGDTIALAAPPTVNGSNAAVDAQRAALMALGQERRLVADLGHKSAYGHEVLDLVDARTARGLLASEVPVYVVNGSEPVDTTHSYLAKAESPDGKVKRNESAQVVERQFTYTLDRVEDPAGLGSAGPAKGLPASLAGVYKNSGLTPQIVGTDNQLSLARVDGKLTQRDADHKGNLVDRSLPSAPLLEKARVPLTHGDTNAAVAFGFAATLAGAGVVALTGLPLFIAPALGAAAAAVGYNCFDGFLRSSQGQALEG